MGLGAEKTKKVTSVESINIGDEGEEVAVGKNYGKPRKYDKAFKGPVQNRGCTDVICCLLFVTFLAGIGVVAYFAFVDGNPEALIYPSDYRGQLCGITEAVKDKPNLFIFDWLDCLNAGSLIGLSCQTMQVCVELCPSTTYTILTRYLGSPAALIDWNDFICRYDVNPQEYVGTDTVVNLGQLILNELCADYYVASAPFGGRCFPNTFVYANGTTPNGRNATADQVQSMDELVSRLLSVEQIENIVDDFLNTWPYIVAGLSMALLFCIFIMILMQWMASIVVWAIIALFVSLLVFGNYFCYNQYFLYKSNSLCGNIGDTNFNYLDLNCYLESPIVWLAFGIILSVVGGIIILILLVLFNRIRLATALIEEASVAIGMMLSTLFGPVIPFILQIAFACFWGVVMVFLTTVGQAKYLIFKAPVGSNFTNGTDCDPLTFNATENAPTECLFQTYDVPSYRIYLQVYMVFALFWMVNFIIAFGEMSIAGAFASYYWAVGKPKDIPAVPILSSMWISLRYHLGSLAFGSLIVTIVQMIRVMLEYVESKLQGGLNNAITRFIICCCKCFFWCLEKFIRFINRNAYIEIAIYGRSFCPAAKDAFFLLMRNILRAAVLNSITSFMLFVFKVTVTLGMSVGSFYFFTWETNPFFTIPPLNYLWGPIVVIGLFSYVIAAVVFGVYDMGIDTLFLCFLEDLERNDGSLEKPYRSPKSLMSIIGKQNKKPRKQTDKKFEEVQGTEKAEKR